MFDKNKFSCILKKINETYNTMTEFAQKASFDRTYISKYINLKLDNPPTPKILGKISKASNNITTYEELMLVCGYLEKNMEFSEISKKIFNKYLPVLKELDLNDDLLDIMYKMSLNTKEYEKQFDDLVDKLPMKKRNKVYEISSNIISETNDILDNAINNISIRAKYNIDDNISNKLFNIPILGKIAAGQPLLADEYLEGYLPVDPNIYGMTTPDDYFYLKVSGESMNLKIHNGDYALVHKQDYAENGDIIVAIVNGDDEATLKRYKKINDEMIMLEPMSTYPMEPIVINLKNTNFKIIGKAIGQFGKF